VWNWDDDSNKPQLWIHCIFS